MILKSVCAAIQLALSRIKLYFARCCALKQTGTFASEIKVMCLFYLILSAVCIRSDILMFRIPDISQCVNNYFETEKC